MPEPKREWRLHCHRYAQNCCACGRVVEPMADCYLDVVSGHLVRHVECHEQAETRGKQHQEAMKRINAVIDQSSERVGARMREALASSGSYGADGTKPLYVGGYEPDPNEPEPEVTP